MIPLIKRFIFPVLILLLALLLKIIVPDAAVVPQELQHYLGLLGSVFIIVAVSWALVAFLRTAKLGLLKRYDISQADNLHSRKVYTQYNILEKILVFIIIVIAISATLMLFDGFRNIGISLFASAGLAGLILGLAAQKVLGTILAGLQIAITQPIRMDDVVIVENEWGWIEEINLTYVVIKIWDQRRLVVPSTYFLENAFQNWTRTSADILGTVFIYTDYSMPVEALRKELSRLLKTTPLWDGRVDVLQVTNATPNTLEIRALMSAESSPKAWDLRVYIREKLVEFIQKEYPHCLPVTRVVMQQKEQK
ncbi:MAG: mechanosensitive ion channel [Bacteroidales bacterium]|nr:mechanosensitive ion channel [Bacteroidales bacterium]